MTTPPAPRVLAPLARPEVVIEAFRSEARAWHASYRRHINRCPFACRTGGLCLIGQRALDEADSAGLRLQRAEERLNREARP